MMLVPWNTAGGRGKKDSETGQSDMLIGRNAIGEWLWTRRERLNVGKGETRERDCCHSTKVGEPQYALCYAAAISTVLGGC